MEARDMSALYPVITLKQGRDSSVLQRHPWIFSGALKQVPKDLEQGDLVQVQSDQGELLGTGTYSAQTSIAVRVFEFGLAQINADWLRQKIKAAHDRRLAQGYGPGTQTTAYRVVFGEADGLPGLVLDRYADVWVLQISTAGMERLKETVILTVRHLFNPQAIVERNDIAVRKAERLTEILGMADGPETEQVAFKEHGLHFEAPVWLGQKTGFFLDQKDLRQRIETLARDKTVLDAFAYTGAAGIYALRGGASKVTFLDSSQTALTQVEKHVQLNFPQHSANAPTLCQDAFEFFAKAPPQIFDMVLLDPPAFIKTQRDKESGQKAYHFINRCAMRLVKDGGLLVTSSCSHFLNPEDFAWILRWASSQAKVYLTLLDTIHQSPDHPLSLYFPESQYLKSYVFQVQQETR